VTVAAWVLCGIGVFFSFTGAVGMLRMPDVYTRIQCSSKTVTMGMVPTLIGLVVAVGPVTQYSGRALIAGALVLLLNPAASHALARAAYKRRVPMWAGSVVDEPAGRPAAREDDEDGDAGR
jgi:multicomponent Na+:H+ antiporter subunit G